MRDAISKVKEFVDKHFSGLKRVSSTHSFDTLALRSMGANLGSLANLANALAIQRGPMLRAHLMLEELGELLVAMGDKDDEAILDGLADLCYVVIGTAIDYKLPLAEAFDEVHRSNMTKFRVEEGDIRMRDKGPDYSPPDIKGILHRHRS